MSCAGVHLSWASREAGVVCHTVGASGFEAQDQEVTSRL